MNLKVEISAEIEKVRTAEEYFFRCFSSRLHHFSVYKGSVSCSFKRRMLGSMHVWDMNLHSSRFLDSLMLCSFRTISARPRPPQRLNRCPRRFLELDSSRKEKNLLRMDVVSEDEVTWLPEHIMLEQPLLKWLAFYIAAKLAARLCFGAKGQSVQEVSSCITRS